MSTINAHCWVDGCRACGPDAVAGEVCDMTLPLAQPAPDATEQARRDRVTAAIVKWQRKPPQPPRRWGRR